MQQCKVIHQLFEWTIKSSANVRALETSFTWRWVKVTYYYHQITCAHVYANELLYLWVLWDSDLWRIQICRIFQLPYLVFKLWTHFVMCYNYCSILFTPCHLLSLLFTYYLSLCMFTWWISVYMYIIKFISMYCYLLYFLPHFLSLLSSPWSFGS